MIHTNRNWWQIIVVILLLATPFISAPTPVAASAQIIQVDANNNTISSSPTLTAGQVLTLYVKVTNISAVDVSNVTISTSGSCVGVTMNIQTGAQKIAAGDFEQYVLTAAATADSTAKTCNSIRVTSSLTTSVSATLRFNVAAAESTPTPTPSPASICETNDPPSDVTGAPRLSSNAAVDQGLCTPGDIDTYALPMNKDKVYDIYISKSYTELDDGTRVQSLDLVLELYDSLNRLVVVNDDFYAHNSGDKDAIISDPKIASYRAPLDGTYYVRVRDATGVNTGFYTLNFNNLSYRGGSELNNNDDTVPENSGVCQDLYEPDGLPEQARMILSNQRQSERRLCPKGDADWVKFFAKSGNTYMLYTSTGPNTAGVDTILSLFDRDGVTVIDSNDNYQSTNLDSKVLFTPSADGFYYAQIKNTGDLGGPFFTYELINAVCNELNQATCAPSVPTNDTAPNTETQDKPEESAPAEDTESQDTNSENTDSSDEESFDFGDEYWDPDSVDPEAEDQGTEDPESDVGFFTTSVRPTGELFDGPVRGFVDSAFEILWNRTERPIVRQQVDRGWLWGPAGLTAHAESYLQISGGQRQVQYFDKGRMEINNPNGNRKSKWYVTSGLLVSELISGRMQVGSNDYIAREPSTTVVFGDVNNTLSPTYASFNKLLGLRTINRTGQFIDQQIARDGSITQFNENGASVTRLVYYVDETGHNIPQVFYTYLTRNDTIYVNGRTEYGPVMDWVHTMGMPLTEAYWARTTIGGEKQWTLVQLFERRVLIYVPSNPSNWQVEQGNVGRHYYRWRYGIDP